MSLHRSARSPVLATATARRFRAFLRLLRCDGREVNYKGGVLSIAPGENYRVTLMVNISQMVSPLYKNCDLEWRLAVNDDATGVTQDTDSCVWRIEDPVS